jgi:hypothetical protein
MQAPAWQPMIFGRSARGESPGARTGVRRLRVGERGGGWSRLADPAAVAVQSGHRRGDADLAGPTGTGGAGTPWLTASPTRGGPRTPYGPGEPWPARVDQFLADGLDGSDVDRWAQSASVLHSNGDAMDIAVKDGRIVGVRGRAVDRVNHGRLDPKDLYGWQANNSPDRLHRPPPGNAASWSRPTGIPRWAASWTGPGNCSTGRAAGTLRLLHLGPAVPGGVLHPRGDR